MNPLTNVRNIAKLNEDDLRNKRFDVHLTWHSQYKDSAYIFIGGLPYDLTEGDVLCVFSQYGEVVNINLVRDKKTGKFKGYGFLCYQDQRSTILAVDNFNGLKLGGRTIRVDHVSEYRVPKSDEKDDFGKFKEKIETGCAPKELPPQPIEDELLGNKPKKKKKDKDKKKKKKKKKKNKSHQDSSASDSDIDKKDLISKNISSGQENPSVDKHTDELLTKSSFKDNHQKNSSQWDRLPLEHELKKPNTHRNRKSRSRSRERIRDRSRSRERVRDRSRSRERVRDRSRSRENRNDHQGRNRERKFSRSRSRERIRDINRSGEQKRDRSRSPTDRRNR